MPRRGFISHATAVLLTGGLLFAAAGCEKPKEKVLDIEAPGVDIEVEKAKDGSELNIDAGTPNEGASIKIEPDTDGGGSVKIEEKSEP